MADRGWALLTAAALTAAILAAAHVDLDRAPTLRDEAWRVVRADQLAAIRDQARGRREVVTLGTSVLGSALPPAGRVQGALEQLGVEDIVTGQLTRCGADWDVLPTLQWATAEGVDTLVVESTQLFYRHSAPSDPHRLTQDLQHLRRRIDERLQLDDSAALDQLVSVLTYCARRERFPSIAVTPEYTTYALAIWEEGFLGDQPVEALLSIAPELNRLILLHTDFRHPDLPLPAAHRAAMDEALETLEASPYIEVWRCPLVFKPADFYSAAHLNTSGQARFTRWYVKKLARELR